MIALLQKIFVPIIAMIWATFYYFEVMKLPAGNHYLIQPAYYIMLVLFIINTATDIIKWKKENKKNESTSHGKPEEDKVLRNKDLITISLVVLVCIVHLSVIKFLGFILSTLVFVIVEMIILQSKNKLMLVIVPLITTLILYLLFTKILLVPLPQGILRGL